MSKHVAFTMGDMPLNTKRILVIFSQDVEVEESPAPVCCTIVTMFCCENKYYKKPTSKLYSILDLHDAHSTEMQEPVVIEGNRLIPSHTY